MIKPSRTLLAARQNGNEFELDTDAVIARAAPARLKDSCLPNPVMISLSPLLKVVWATTTMCPS
jgi:hypothetical protein